jgi:hypothetical protein
MFLFTHVHNRSFIERLTTVPTAVLSDGNSDGLYPGGSYGLVGQIANTHYAHIWT